MCRVCNTLWFGFGYFLFESFGEMCGFLPWFVSTEVHFKEAIS